MSEAGMSEGGDSLDEILDEFEVQCPMPSLDDLAAWQAHHPEHARALLARAADMADHVMDLVDEIRDELAEERAAGREPPEQAAAVRRDLH